MDNQLQERLMMFGGFIPGAVSLVILLIVWYVHAFKQSRTLHEEHEETNDEQLKRKAHVGPRWALPIVLALGFAGADYAANETMFLWPESNSYRFTHAIGLIMLVGVIEGLVRLPIAIGFVVRAIGMIGAFWMLTEGYPGVFGGNEAFIGSAVFVGLIGSLLVSVSERSSESTPGWIDALSWLMIAGVSMRMFLLNHFSTGAMIPAGIIAVLVSAGMVSLVFKSLRFSRGANTVLVGFVLTMLSGSIVQTGADYLPGLLLLACTPLVFAIPVKAGLGSIGRFLVTRLPILVILLGCAIGTSEWSIGFFSESGDDAPSSDQVEGFDDEYDPYADLESE